ncbi:MAG: hypothetical protein Roseis2KO_13820 [Roseivirga sp.]
MNAKNKFPKDKGAPIRVGKAKAEQARWKKNPKNKDLPDTFPVSVEQLQLHIEKFDCNGIEFCNGSNQGGDYTPVMAAVDGEGNILAAFNNDGDISIDEFKSCRENWRAQHPDPDTTQFFYLGEEAITTNITDFDVVRYEAAFVEESSGTNSAVLYGYSYDGMKDPGDEEPDTALNRSYLCPPFCGEDEN